MSTVLQAKARNDLKRSTLRQIREDGNIPAVIYGSKLDSQPVYLSAADFTKTIREVGRNGMISLDVEGKKHDVVLTQYQQNLKREVTHADFLAVDKSSKINVHVRLVLIGDAAGVKDGGVLQQPVHELAVTAAADKIPQQVEVDVTNLQVGDTVTVADLRSNQSYSIDHEDDLVLASVLPPKQEEEINAGEQQAPGHPENEEGRETEPTGE